MRPPPPFAPGSVVRVNYRGRRVGIRKQALAGSVGTVVTADGARVVVDFPAQGRRESFLPDELEPAGPSARPMGKRK